MKSLVPVILFVIGIENSASEIDLRFLDETTNPCDDFYQFSCGNFKNYHERPENESMWDLFSLTEADLVKIGKAILSSPKKQNDPVALKKAKAAYKACNEIAQVDRYEYYNFPEKSIIEEYGGMPLISDDPITKISFSDIARLSAQFGIYHFFQILVKNFNPEMYLVMFYADSKDSIEMIRPRVIKSYDEILEESFKKLAKTGRVRARLLGEEDPLDTFMFKISQHLLQVSNVRKSEDELRADLKDVKDFTAKLFAGGIQDDDMIDMSSPITVEDLQQWTSDQFGDDIDVDWLDFFNQQFNLSGINITGDFWIYPFNTSTIYGVLNLIRKTDPKIVKNYLLLRTFLHMAPDSDLPMRKAFEEYYRSTGSRFYERPEFCARKLLDVIDSTSLSFAITNDYFNYHFNVNKISEAVKIIQNTRETFKEVVRNSAWVDEATRQKVLQKIDNIVVFLGYPDFVDNDSLDEFYENLRICEWDNFGNAQRIRAFRKAYALKEYEDHDLWTVSPFEVNAYAIRASNRIMAPISIISSSYLQGDNPVFDYSRFGTIVAHEFIHHFDSFGVNYDSNGMQIPLLVDATKESFLNKTDCFVEQFSNFYLSEIDDYVRGDSTLDENLADSGGIRHAYAAFLKVIESELKNDYGKNRKYTPQQEFFINFATTYCSDTDNAYLQHFVQHNQHSPPRARVIGTLVNLKEFADAFNCPVGSKMNPKEKCQLW